MHPDATAYTWWDYRAGNFHKGLGLRIDYLLATPDLAEKAQRCGMARDYRKGKKPSDHAPLFAQFGQAEDGIDIAGRVRLQTGLSAIARLGASRARSSAG